MNIEMKNATDELYDFSEGANIKLALQLGMLDTYRKAIQKHRLNLIAQYWSKDYIESIHQNVEITETQTYAFAQVHAALQAGHVFLNAIKMPTRGPKTFFEAKTHIERLLLPNLTFSLSLPVEEQECILSIAGNPTFSNIPWQFDDAADQKISIVKKTFANPKFVLDIEKISATRTFAYLKFGWPIARWMPDSNWLHLFIPTDQVQSQYLLNE
jgi:hypothetical protein